MKFASINSEAVWDLAHPLKPKAGGLGKRGAPQAQVDVKSVDQSSFRQVSKKIGVLDRCATPSMQAPREVRQAPDFASIMNAAVKLGSSDRR